VDGQSPRTALVEGSDGYLYGTTIWGGASGKGTVYKLTKDGAAFETLHSFSGGSDGKWPWSPLLVGVGGQLFGTTRAGGSSDKGAIFRIDVSGTMETLHSFSGIDGAEIFCSLEMANGFLFGATTRGGANDKGTVFRFDPVTQDLLSLYDISGSGDALDSRFQGDLTPEK